MQNDTNPHVDLSIAHLSACKKILKQYRNFRKQKKTFKIRCEKEDKNEAKIDSPQNHNWPRLK